MREKIWVKNLPKINAEALSKELGLNTITIKYLASKGLDTSEKIRSFINFKEDDLRSYKDYKDSEMFLDTLIDSLKSHEEITIYADYDYDGVSAATIWMRGLKRLRANVNFFVNNRFTEGYGLNPKGMERLIQTYPNTKLIVTCDNGVVAVDGVEYALNKGIKVIVSDHHIARPDGVLPNCPVVCEHRVDENKDVCENICGAEMSRRLIVGLYDKIGLYPKEKPFLDSLKCFSGSATIADSVPFTAANHYLVKQGLAMIKQSPYPCWKIIRDLMDIKSLDETAVGFSIAPVINAISRLTGDVTKAILMFTSNDHDECLEIARELVNINDQRKKLSAENETMAEKEYQKRIDDDFIILADTAVILSEEDGVNKFQYDEGICGIIASRMTENYGKPCAVLTPLHETPEIYKGSVRSVDGFNVKEALDKCQDLLEGYGGHDMAAGISVHQDNIEALRKRLSELVRESKVLESPIYVNLDLIVTVDDINNDAINELMSLAPFGMGFERPNLCVYGKYDSIFMMPKAGPYKHVSFMLKSRMNSLKVLWWNSVKHWNDVQATNPEELAVIGKIELNAFNGKIVPQLIVDKNKVKNFNEIK